MSLFVVLIKKKIYSNINNNEIQKKNKFSVFPPKIKKLSFCRLNIYNEIFFDHNISINFIS